MAALSISNHAGKFRGGDRPRDRNDPGRRATGSQSRGNIEAGTKTAMLKSAIFSRIFHRIPAREVVKTGKKEDAIRADMQLAGTYNKAFEPMIALLAKVQTQLAAAERKWRSPDFGKAEFVTEYTNKAGATNTVKNPYFAVVEDLRAEVVSISAQLGLTPQGQRRVLGGMAPRKSGPSKLEAAMRAAAKAAGK